MRENETAWSARFNMTYSNEVIGGCTLPTHEECHGSRLGAKLILKRLIAWNVFCRGFFFLLFPFVYFATSLGIFAIT